MKSSTRARRMARNHRRLRHATLPLVALVDIFTNVLIFLLINVGETQVLDQDRAIKLPISVVEQRPDYTLLIKINASEISVDGRVVASVPAVLASHDAQIAPLQQVLAADIARRPLTELEKQQGRAVTIMGDKELPYELLKRVMTTCAQADFRHVAFAVDQQQPATVAAASGFGPRGA